MRRNLAYIWIALIALLALAAPGCAGPDGGAAAPAAEATGASAGASGGSADLQYSLEGKQEYETPEEQEEEIRDAMEAMGNELLADVRVARALMDSLDDDGDRMVEKAYDLKLQADIFALLEDPRFGYAEWGSLSDDERTQNLTAFYSEVDAALSTSAVGLVFADEAENIAGYYNASSHILTLNTKHLSEQGLFHTVIHEMRHAYQSDAVANPTGFAVSAETISWWAQPFIDPTEENYDAYFTQPREWDARNFAKSDIEIFSVPPPYTGSWDMPA
ncbi:MAG: hypothetical protein LBR44_08615 [Clostridiales Family XIII bacterium]|jgi:hypothetical protein|nr:hypothetical protein [Clostridiales Family XIII bacterium]